MKIKKLLGMLMIGVLLFNTIPVGAFINSCEGQWGTSTGVTYKYNSDGTLVIRGETGSEVIGSDVNNTANNLVTDSTEWALNWSSDVKTVIIDNVDTIFKNGSTASYCMFGSNKIKHISLNARVIDTGVFARLTSAETIILGEDVRRIESKAFNAWTDDKFTIYMPSTIEYIAEDAYHSYGSGIQPNITVVCEYGSTAYNWAKSLKVQYPSATINIELMDILAQSNVVVDNSQNYQVVVPETISFEKSADGWFGDSFLGLVGRLNGYVTVKTNKSFKVVGEDDPSSENVTVSTDNASTTEDNGFLKTVVGKQDLADATDEIDINGTPAEGYRIDYECKVDSERIMRQKYTGTLNYIISEE